MVEDGLIRWRKDRVTVNKDARTTRSPGRGWGVMNRVHGEEGEGCNVWRGGGDTIVGRRGPIG